MFEYQAQISEIIDGDTVDAVVDLGFHISQKMRLRLAGINAPELHSKNKKEKAAAQAAKAYLAKLVDTTTVTIRTKKDKTEKYGRYLAYIDHAGKDVNQAMIDAGHAVAYDGGKR